MKVATSAEAPTGDPSAVPGDGRTPAASRYPRSRLAAFVSIAGLGLTTDLLTKSWSFQRLGCDPSRDRIGLVEGYLSLETTLNEGALFGRGNGYSHVFAVLSIVAAVGICYWLFVAGAARDRLLTFALAGITGGILGNLYDRLGLPGLVWNYGGEHHRAGERVHAVRDWIHFQTPWFDWPIFNIADCLLVVGAGLLLWHAFRGEPAKTPPTA